MDYYVVVDLEMCKVPKENKTEAFHWKQETIQIGAVLLNGEYEIVDKFNTMVSPEFGYLDPFVKRLTGITPVDVAGAPKMAEAMRMFTDWIPKGDVRIVSWSDSDEKQFRHEIEGKSIVNSRMEELLDSWIDCQVTFSEKMDAENRYTLREALIAANIIQEGSEHDGLTDAYNTAILFKKMETEENFKLNELYEAARYGEVEHLSCTIGELIKVSWEN